MLWIYAAGVGMGGGSGAAVLVPWPLFFSGDLTVAVRGAALTLTYTAWDTGGNTRKTGDAANHTLRWVKDGVSAAPSGSPTEVDAANAKGEYKVTLTTTEADAAFGTLTGVSSTSGVEIIPVKVTFVADVADEAASAHNTVGTFGHIWNFITSATVANSTGSAGTVISGSAAFCSVSDFLSRWDYRSVGRLLSRDDRAIPTLAQVQANTDLALFLLEASGWVEAAILRGGRQSVADLQALQSPTMTNGGQLLSGLVADLTMWRVWDSRPDREGKLPERCRLALDMLEQLSNGERIFGFAATAAAGRIDHQRLSPTEVTLRNDDSIINERYFGRRDDRNPGNPYP